jgi:hypothetical protein
MANGGHKLGAAGFHDPRGHNRCLEWIGGVRPGIILVDNQEYATDRTTAHPAVAALVGC